MQKSSNSSLEHYKKYLLISMLWNEVERLQLHVQDTLVCMAAVPFIRPMKLNIYIWKSKRKTARISLQFTFHARRGAGITKKHTIFYFSVKSSAGGSQWSRVSVAFVLPLPLPGPQPAVGTPVSLMFVNRQLVLLCISLSAGLLSSPPLSSPSRLSSYWGVHAIWDPWDVPFPLKFTFKKGHVRVKVRVR